MFTNSWTFSSPPYSSHISYGNPLDSFNLSNFDAMPSLHLQCVELSSFCGLVVSSFWFSTNHCYERRTELMGRWRETCTLFYTEKHKQTCTHTHIYTHAHTPKPKSSCLPSLWNKFDYSVTTIVITTVVSLMIILMSVCINVVWSTSQWALLQRPKPQTFIITGTHNAVMKLTALHIALQ